MRKRTEQEIAEMMKDFASGMKPTEVFVKHDISQTGFYRLLAQLQGVGSSKKADAQVEKLQKKLAEREKEIRLLKTVLKKS